MIPLNTTLLAALILVFLACLFAYKAIKVVPKQTAWIVERLGKFNRVLNPGLNFIIPFIFGSFKHSIEKTSKNFNTRYFILIKKIYIFLINISDDPL